MQSGRGCSAAALPAPPGPLMWAEVSSAQGARALPPSGPAVQVQSVGRSAGGSEAGPRPVVRPQGPRSRVALGPALRTPSAQLPGGAFGTPCGDVDSRPSTPGRAPGPRACRKCVVPLLAELHPAGPPLPAPRASALARAPLWDVCPTGVEGTGGRAAEGRVQWPRWRPRWLLAQAASGPTCVTGTAGTAAPPASTGPCPRRADASQRQTEALLI